MIRKKLVRKTLDMIKKIADEKYNDTFWKEFGTNIKLGVIEDHSNRTRLAKLLRFQSSHHATDITSLDQYVERMKEKQDKIYFMAGSSRKEVRLDATGGWPVLGGRHSLLSFTQPLEEGRSPQVLVFHGRVNAVETRAANLPRQNSKHSSLNFIG